MVKENGNVVFSGYPEWRLGSRKNLMGLNHEGAGGKKIDVLRKLGN